MNRFIPKILCLLFLFSVTTHIALAQLNKQTGLPQVMTRCGTDEAIQRNYQTNPVYRAMVDQREREYQAWKAQNQGNINNIAARTSTLTGPVTIPIVVHVVLPNPEIVTDAAVAYFVNRLNLDYSGLNPDSTNGTSFYSVRGHSLIRFCLAKRDPNGNFTTGIERKVGNAVIGTNTYQPIKHTSAGGLDPWDITKYYNLWTGAASGGLLGIAPAIGPGVATETTTSTTGIDGVCVNYQGFSNDPCYSIAAFAMARTAVHEIGHNFGLFHTFSGCSTGADMGQMSTSASCAFPASILSLPDDTPDLSSATSGCPSGTVASNCASAPNPPGKMYQNYMDYTDDPCYSMFTKTQVARMEWVLENCRAGYLTSNGCQLPSSIVAIDGAITAIVNPGGSEVVGCNSISYTVPTCPGSFSPKVRVQNQGSTTMTSVTISTTTSAGTTTTTYPVNLAYGQSTVITLTPINSVVGANTLTTTITLVNGSADALTANNTQTTTFTIAAPTALPRATDFVTTTFPPTGFTIYNADGATTWVRNANGNGNVGSAFIDCYDYTAQNQIDDVRSTAASFPAFPATDSVILTFDVSHKPYSATATSSFLDTLSVFYSKDCGTTWTYAGYRKWGATLATGAASTAAYTTPTAWRNERVAVGGAAALSGGQIQFAIRCTNRYGNNIFLDNINISIPVNRDAGVSAINNPTAAICSPTFAPQVIVKNFGLQPITSYQVSYQIDANTAVTSPVITTALAVGGTATYTFPSVTTTVGTHTFTSYTSNIVNASGTGDQNATNDASTMTFLVRALALAPVVEGFETTPFPSAGWTIYNPQANNTWVRNTANGGFAQSSNSAFIDNYSFNLVGEADDIVSLPVNCLGADSVIVKFDVAHKNYTGFSDSLKVLYSNNCGISFLPTTYAKGGATLATAGASTAAYTSPIATDWRTDRVAIGGAALSNGSIFVALRNINAYGNNIFLDNINISLVYKRDIQAVSVVKPNSAECSGSFTPSLLVKNLGIDTVKSFTASYSIDGGTAVATNITGLALATNTSNTYTLAPISGLAIGAHTIKMYTSNLVTNGGTGDQFMLNDTTTKVFTVLGTQIAPLVEGFETTTTVPTNWGINNADNNITWTRDSVGYNSANSFTVKNFNYSNAASSTKVDDLLTPNISFTNVDSVYLSFDIAALTKQYPGATNIALDSLEILVSSNCGVTSTSVYNKWGSDLQTVNDPNYSNTAAFRPSSNNQWRHEKLNITSAVGTTSTGFVVYFRNKSNNDNNIYLDNININTLTLPARLKQQGYLIYPSPFSGNFNVQHYLPATDLKGIDVFDSRGRLVYRKEFTSGNANSSENVNISREASGVYTVRLNYTNKVVTERIIKTN